jgi:flagellar motility protein MotE (MotC chaperone)
MFSKKKILILGGMAIATFAATFFLSSTLKPHEQAASRPAGADQAASSATSADVAMPVLGAKEKELDELIKAVREKSEELQKRQEKLNQRERRLGILQGQIKEQANELETLRMSLVTPLARLKEAKEQLEGSRVVIATEERANLKRSAAIYETMDAVRSGQIVAEMCTNNQEEDAVRILYLMSERAAGKILQELPDKGLAARLLVKIKRVREQG